VNYLSANQGRANTKKGTDWTPWLTIVGIAPDIGNKSGLQRAKKVGALTPYTRIYLPQKQNLSRWMNLRIKGQGDVKQYAAAVSRVIHQISPKMAPYDYRTIEDHLALNDNLMILITDLVSLFALASLFMAAAGLYGLVSFTSEQKNREYGIRMALGASRGNILTLVLKNSRWQLLIGLVFGFAISTAMIKYMIQQFDQMDNMTLMDVWYIFPISTLIVALLMFIASFIPAWRAANLAPNNALHEN
jgi:ABC-type antimicrobial peptide transport system permease subunit